MQGLRQSGNDELQDGPAMVDTVASGQHIKEVNIPLQLLGCAPAS